MKLGVCIPCFFGDLSFPEAVKRVKALGYDRAEIWGYNDLDLPAAKKALEENGVELTNMCPKEFRMTDPEYRDLWLRGIEEACGTAAYLSVPRLITQVGPDTGAPRKEQHASIVAALKAALPILEKYKVTLMIEPLNTYVDHQGYYLTTAKEGAEIVREVGSPFVKMIFDIYHQQIMEGNIIPNIKEYMDTIAHLHCAGHPGRHEPWNGETDYRVVFKAAEEAGYHGMCGLEYFPLLPPEESLKICKETYA